MWGITCFVLHQLRSTDKECDALHHQHQAILRTSLDDANVLWQLIRMCWAWKLKTTSVFWRSSPLLLITLVHLATFLLAGAFSSRITATDGEVLVKSNLCGWLNEWAVRDPAQWTEINWGVTDSLFVTAHWGYKRSAEYARLCYNSELGTHPSLCHRFSKQNIQSKVDTTAPCPFSPRTCGPSAITLDSGLIDSHLDLGINAPQEARIQLRKVMTCAPVPVEERFSTTWTPGGLEDIAGDTFKYYYVGDRFGWGEKRSGYTFRISNFSMLTSSDPYTVSCVSSTLIYIPLPPNAS